MNKIVLIALLLSFTEVPILFSQPDSLATLEVTFTGIRSTTGQIAIGINDSPEGWPRSPKLDPNWLKSKKPDGTMTVRIPDLPYGTYAVSALDDENKNLEMDTFLGIPQEGYGFSRDAKVKLSPPKFEDCEFKIDKPLVKITIQFRYFGKGE